MTDKTKTSAENQKLQSRAKQQTAGGTPAEGAKLSIVIEL